MMTKKIKNLLLFGLNADDNEEIPFLFGKRRFEHIYILGSTGVGKSTLILNLIRQDLRNKLGIIVLDPSGTLCQNIASYIPPERELVYISLKHPTVFNPLQRPDLHKFDIIDEFREVMNAYISRTTSTSETTVLMNEILENALEVLLDLPEYSNIKSLYEFLTFRHKRAEVFSKTKKTLYWEEFDTRVKREKQESALRLASRLNPFVKDPRLYKITSGFNQLDFKDIADNGKILLVDCAKMSRAKMIFFGNLIAHGIKSYFVYQEPDSPLAFYIDEFQNFINEDFEKILSEGRKYKIAFTLAHQDHSQIPPKLLGSIMGNAGTVIAFRCGVKEADTLAKHFQNYDFNTIHNLPDFRFCARIGIDEFLIDGLPEPKPLKENSLFKIQSSFQPKPPAPPSTMPIFVSEWNYRQPLKFFSFQ